LVAAAGAGAQVRIGMPSGVLTVDAKVSRDSAGEWLAHSGAFYRTARRLFDRRISCPPQQPRR
jgi:2-methylaconitate isomerase